MYDEDKIKFIFDLVDAMVGVEQREEYHPEGDVFNHSIQVLHWALRESDDIDLVVAALLHDVGKAYEPLKHAEIARSLLANHVSEKSMWLIENHMRIWKYMKGEMRKLSKVKKMANSVWLRELVQLARWDKLGRNPNKKINYNKQELMSAVLALREKSS